jgi:hypothetical protein
MTAKKKTVTRRPAPKAPEVKAPTPRPALVKTYAEPAVAVEASVEPVITSASATADARIAAEREKLRDIAKPTFDMLMHYPASARKVLATLEIHPDDLAVWGPYVVAAIQCAGKLGAEGI